MDLTQILLLRGSLKNSMTGVIELQVLFISGQTYTAAEMWALRNPYEPPPAGIYNNFNNINRCTLLLSIPKILEFIFDMLITKEFFVNRSRFHYIC